MDSQRLINFRTQQRTTTKTTTTTTTNHLSPCFQIRIVLGGRVGGGGVNRQQCPMTREIDCARRLLQGGRNDSTRERAKQQNKAKWSESGEREGGRGCKRTAYDNQQTTQQTRERERETETGGRGRYSKTYVEGHTQTHTTARCEVPTRGVGWGETTCTRSLRKQV